MMSECVAATLVCACERGNECIPELCYSTHSERMIAYVKILSDSFPNFPQVNLGKLYNAYHQRMIMSLFNIYNPCILCGRERGNLVYVSYIKDNIYYSKCIKCNDSKRKLCPRTFIDTISCAEISDAAARIHIEKVFLLCIDRMLLPEIISIILSDVLLLNTCLHIIQ